MTEKYDRIIEELEDISSSEDYNSALLSEIRNYVRSIEKILKKIDEQVDFISMKK